METTNDGYPAETLEKEEGDKSTPDFLSEAIRDDAMKRLNFFGE